jgi:prephenate dehydrogenase
MEEIGWRISPGSTEETTLAAKRDRIDSLDETIAKLLKERLALATEIGQLKAQRKLPIKDGAREQVVLDHVRSVVNEPILAEAVCRVYEQLLKESRELQDKPVVAESAATDGKTYFPRVLIIGCGLIGGALARQIKSCSPGTVVVGSDLQPVLDSALQSMVIDEGVADCEEAIKKSSLIILAASPKQNMDLLKKIAPQVKRRQVIIDVTSTKLEICKLAEELNLKADFIGGHPFSGTQKSGFANSAEVQLTGKTFALVPTKRSSELTVRRLSRWLEQLGMRVQVVDAQSHDDTVADTSHLVQLLSVALGSQIANGASKIELNDKLQMSGPALKAVARLMGSPYKMWSEILQQNSSSICSSLLSMEKRLQLMRSAISDGQLDVVAAQFDSAKKVSETLL